LGFEKSAGGGVIACSFERVLRAGQCAIRSWRRKDISGPADYKSDSPIHFKTGGGLMAPMYPIEVLWSDEDHVWIANVPDLPLCSAHGSTPHQAVEEVEVAIAAWLDAATTEGWAIPLPSTRPVKA
jgi:predicted RNase H-like HicB family nuclease